MRVKSRPSSALTSFAVVACSATACGGGGKASSANPALDAATGGDTSLGAPSSSGSSSGGVQTDGSGSSSGGAADATASSSGSGNDAGSGESGSAPIVAILMTVQKYGLLLADNGGSGTPMFIGGSTDTAL
jgi:hypothetical protein